MRFVGEVKTKWLNDGHLMELLEDIQFIDAKGTTWYAFKGTVLNGADIPKPLWSIVGSPYVGLHRRPSVFHDEYCKNRTRPHEAVHRMFFEAMLTENMPYNEAWSMYVAVRDFGPKWDEFGKDLKPTTDCDERNL